MRKLMGILCLLAILLCAVGLAEDCSLYVPRVEGLPEDFALGMDVSSVISLENSGVRYYDYEGNEADLFAVLADSGVNWIRVRVWNDPYDADGNGYGGGNCDIDTAVAIAKRASAYGMRLLVDFHYSDFWADPSKQQLPKAWKGLREAGLKEQLYSYTADCLTQLLRAGADIGMVQLGNETNNAFCGFKNWKVICSLMNEAARAVRDTVPGALVAVHFTNP